MPTFGIMTSIRQLRSIALAWFIEVVSLTGDETVVRAILAAEDYDLTERHDGNSTKRVLRHDKHQRYSEASEVNADAQHLANRLARFSAVQDTPLGISFGPVHRVDTDGSTSKHIFVQLTSVLSVACTGTVTVIRNPAVADEERVKLEAEAAARAAEIRRQMVIRRGEAAMKDARVLDLMELLKVEKLSPTQMGHIVDLVRDLSAGKLDALASGNEVKRFERSINHPSVMGLDSRHAVTREQPPPKPMTISEASDFARRIGAGWLARLDVAKQP